MNVSCHCKNVDLPLAERVNKRGTNLCHTHADHENHDNLIGFLGATITFSDLPNFPSLPLKFVQR